MSEIHILFDGPPSHESGRFVEVEDKDGHGLSVGKWIEVRDLWHLVIPSDAELHKRIAELEAALRDWGTEPERRATERAEKAEAAISNAHMREISAIDGYDKVKAQRDAALDVLRKYGGHLEDCNAKALASCMCGWEQKRRRVLGDD